MIATLKKGKGFRGCLKYVLGQDKAQLIDTNMLGNNYRELAAEFGISRRLRPNLQNAVCHAILSVSNREKLTVDKWMALASDFREQLGFHNCQYVVARHCRQPSGTNSNTPDGTLRERSCDHIHMVISRIRLDGSVVSDSWDYSRSEKIIRQLEKQYLLESIPSSYEVKQQRLAAQELEKERQAHTRWLNAEISRQISAQIETAYWASINDQIEQNIQQSLLKSRYLDSLKKSPPPTLSQSVNQTLTIQERVEENRQRYGNRYALTQTLAKERGTGR